MVGGSHVLVVEDDPLVADALDEALVDYYRTSRAQTGSQGCACLSSSHIDLVVLDRTLPDGKGDDVIALADRIGIPIIPMSGHPDDIRNLERSDRPHLIKPFGIDALLSKVESVLNGEKEMLP
jgi:DNA-binding response OmpR family regulator